MFIIDTGGYNVILGMAWLSRHHAIIDCRSKVVVFRIPLQEEFSIIGESRADRQIQQGEFGAVEGPRTMIPVEEEYSDVFSDMTPRLPPVRTVVRNICDPGYNTNS